jgi:formylglycine-generating enzyme required for sulfatase activity
MPSNRRQTNHIFWIVNQWATTVVVGLIIMIVGVSSCVPLQHTQTTGMNNKTQALNSGVVMIRSRDGMVMVFIPEGEFYMGSNRGDRDEKPIHKVYLDAYWIDQTEVTNRMFSQFVDETGYQTDAEKSAQSWVFVEASEVSKWEEFSGVDWRHLWGSNSNIDGLDDYPVVHVSWDDAVAYCDWAGAHLPTEAEWERAARGQYKNIYPWGNTRPDGQRANIADVNLKVDWSQNINNDGYEFMAPVGQYPMGMSQDGVLDMAGNVWEWVADWYESDYYLKSPDKNPMGPSIGKGRVLRGGSWLSTDYNIRSTYRRGDSHDFSAINVGFRCSGIPDQGE